MSKRCKDCCHFSQYFVIGEKQCVKCDLTNTILVDKAAEECGLYNVDLDDQPICFNCKHFGGGADWGLACRKHYHALPKALDRMCKDGVFWDTGVKVSEDQLRDINIDITIGE